MIRRQSFNRAMYHFPDNLWGNHNKTQDLAKVLSEILLSMDVKNHPRDNRTNYYFHRNEQPSGLVHEDIIVYLMRLFQINYFISRGYNENGDPD